RDRAPEFASMVREAGELKSSLAAASAPTNFREAGTPFSPDIVRWAVANCHLMRNRFTLVDLLDLLGLWNDELIDRLAATVDGSSHDKNRECCP
ncbi:MAG: hypothetical protein R3C97_08605, partial [Geminicoccaceae bacterium]